MSVALVTQYEGACAVLYCHLWSVPLYNNFPHYLINGTIFEKQLPNLKFCVSTFSTAFVETFLILRIIGEICPIMSVGLHVQYRYCTVYRSACTVPLLYSLSVCMYSTVTVQYIGLHVQYRYCTVYRSACTVPLVLSDFNET